MATLKPGDIAPTFQAKDQFGRTVKSSDFQGGRFFIYFFPKANTSGWTAQSQAVRDALPRLKSLGVAAAGISPDAPAVQKAFDEQHQLGFPLLSDDDHRIAEAYGVWGEKTMSGKTFMGIQRSAFLMDEKGRILAAFYNISPEETVPKLMAALDNS